MVTYVEDAGYILNVDGKKVRLIKAKCDCGKEVVIRAYNLPNTKSCGCKRGTHGGSGTKVYNSWKSMMHRCYKSNDFAWHLYGGRGIGVCKQWHDFENFRSDMEKSWFKGASIDRIDNSLGYSMQNCRWATSKEQCDNRRCSILTRFGKTTEELATLNGISTSAVLWRLKRNKTVIGVTYAS